MLRKLNTKRGGFTLVEIMIVVAIIALLAAIAVPNFLRSRKRSQATQILSDLRVLDAAVDQYAIENNKTATLTAATWADIQRYLKTGTRLYSSGCKDVLGNSYGGGSYLMAGGGNAGFFYVDGFLLISANTYNALSDVAPAAFWSPYSAAGAF